MVTFLFVVFAETGVQLILEGSISLSFVYGEIPINGDWQPVSNIVLLWRDKRNTVHYLCKC